MVKSFALSLIFICIQYGWSFDLQGGISPNPQGFLQKYAMIKLFESCFGTENMYKMKMDVADATKKCLMKDQMPYQEGIELSAINRNTYLHQFVDNGIVDNIKKQYQSPKLQYNPHQPITYNMYGYQPQYYTKPGTNLPYYSQYQQYYRYKRQTDDESIKNQVKDLKNDIMSKLSNVTCVLMEIGILDSNKKINGDGLKETFEKMEIDEIMKLDIQKGIDTCIKFTQCLPLDEFIKSPVGNEIAPAVMFTNCFKGKKVEACIKKDLRERLVELIKNDISPGQVEDILARTNSPEGVAALPETIEDMESFVFAMLYEGEPSSLI